MGFALCYASLADIPFLFHFFGSVLTGGDICAGPWDADSGFAELE